MSGSLASSSQRATSRTWSAGASIGVVERYDDGGRSESAPSSQTPFITLSGTSRWTTPGRPSKHSRSARRTSSGRRLIEGTTPLHLVIGRVTSTCGND